MNCIASSLAAFIVGGVVGFFFAVAIAVAVFKIASLQYSKEQREARVKTERIIDAVAEMVLDDRVEEYVSDDVDGDDANAPTVEYNVPADRWEALVELLESAGEIE